MTIWFRTCSFLICKSGLILTPTLIKQEDFYEELGRVPVHGKHSVLFAYSKITVNITICFCVPWKLLLGSPNIFAFPLANFLRISSLVPTPLCLLLPNAKWRQVNPSIPGFPGPSCSKSHGQCWRFGQPCRCCHRSLYNVEL